MRSRTYGTALLGMETLTPRNPPQDLGSQVREREAGTRSGFRVPRYGNPQWAPDS